MRVSSADSGIRGILFDSYGTLFDMGSVIEKCDELFPGSGRELAVLWRRKQMEYSWLLSLMEQYEDFWKVTERALVFAMKSIGLPSERETKDVLLKSTLELDVYPEVPQALMDLSEYRFGVISNGTLRMLNALLEKNRISRTFHTVISADDVSAFKPCPQLYRVSEHRMDIPLERMLLVSSHSFDVNGAKCSGIRACWVNRKGEQWDSLGFVPDMTVGDLRELVEIMSI